MPARQGTLCAGDPFAVVLEDINGHVCQGGVETSAFRLQVYVSALQFHVLPLDDNLFGLMQCT